MVYFTNECGHGSETPRPTVLSTTTFKCWALAGKWRHVIFATLITPGVISQINTMTWPCWFVVGTTAPQWVRAPSFTRFLYHTQWRTTVSRTPLDEWSAHCRSLYITKHNTHNRQSSMPLVGFEPTLSAGERPQTCVLAPSVPFLSFGAKPPLWARPSSFTKFLDHTQRSNTVRRTPLEEWSARHRDLYLTTQHSQQTNIHSPPVGFEAAILAGKWPRKHASDRAATGTGLWSRPAFFKLWSASSALVVLLDWTLVQKKTEKIKLTWTAYHTV
jgi:hypothetical protein